MHDGSDGLLHLLQDWKETAGAGGRPDSAGTTRLLFTWISVPLGDLIGGT